MEENLFSCKKCQKLYKTYKCLKQHIAKYHPNDLPSATSPRELKFYEFTCDVCHKHFKNKYSFQTHQRNMHNIGEKSRQCSSGLACPLCNEVLPKKDNILHFSEKHDIVIQTESLELLSFEDFISWKNEMEKESNNLFITKCGAYMTEKRTTHYYMCHRSGDFVSKGTGLRHLKLQGSKKICGYCPAEIKATICNNTKKVSVEFVKTHIGHKNEMKHVTLTVEERRQIASKLAQQIPFDTILDEIRDSISEKGLQHIHLLTKKDLFNISTAFNINSNVVRHKNDATSVDAWVHEMNCNVNSCILFYKPQGITLDDYPDLEINDFVLIICNEAQREMLKMYGPDCICVDGTHGTNNYEFEMTTVLVIDDMRQGFPCSFMFSSKSTKTVMSLYFSEIKKKTGEIIPRVFMSDLTNIYFDAWACIMGKPLKQLYCSWHVDRAWRKYLSKIAWTYCNRINVGINTNMHVEWMHKTIKYLYLKGKNAKRLDKSINLIMKFIRDRLFDRLIIINKGKLTAKVSELRKRHKNSLALSTKLVNKMEDHWTVVSSSSAVKEFYSIEEGNLNCKCDIICTYCNACMHKYSCTCIDASIKWNMCKHIHLLCRYIKEENDAQVFNSDENDFVASDSLQIDLSNEGKGIQSDIIVQQLQKDSENQHPTVGSNFEKEVERVCQDFIEKAKGIKTKEQLSAVKRILKTMDATLNATCSTNKRAFSELFDNIPHNKKITPQQGFFSTKKKRKINNKAIKKPTREESQNIALSLILTKNNVDS